MEFHQPKSAGENLNLALEKLSRAKLRHCDAMLEKDRAEEQLKACIMSINICQQKVFEILEEVKRDDLMTKIDGGSIDV